MRAGRAIGRRRKRGALAVEAAFVLPVLYTILLTMPVVGFGVFRYQEMAYLAREGARWASVHGGQYATETGNPAATAADIYSNAIAPRAVMLDASQLTFAVSWPNGNYPYHTKTDASNNLVKVTNNVSVTVSYHWVPEVFFGGVTLTSTSVMPISY